MGNIAVLVGLVTMLSCGGGGTVDPTGGNSGGSTSGGSSSGGTTTACGCSKYNKAQCTGKCRWTVGKGCGC